VQADYRVFFYITQVIAIRPSHSVRSLISSGRTRMKITHPGRKALRPNSNSPINPWTFCVLPVSREPIDSAKLPHSAEYLAARSLKNASTR
jgi:hypothetical protein